MLSQLVSYLGLYFLVQRTGADMSAYYQHVLMLTGIVVSLGTTGVALALLMRLKETFGSVEEDDILRR